MLQSATKKVPAPTFSSACIRKRRSHSFDALRRSCRTKPTTRWRKDSPRSEGVRAAAAPAMHSWPTINSRKHSELIAVANARDKAGLVWIAKLHLVDCDRSFFGRGALRAFENKTGA